MTHFAEPTFAVLRNDLASRLAETVAQFARENGLGVLRQAPLKQMTMSLEETAAEVLMFGCDTWPASALVEEEAPSPFEVPAQLAA